MRDVTSDERAIAERILNAGKAVGPQAAPDPAARSILQAGRSKGAEPLSREEEAVAARILRAGRTAAANPAPEISRRIASAGASPSPAPAAAAPSPTPPPSRVASPSQPIEARSLVEARRTARREGRPVLARLPGWSTARLVHP